MRILPEERLGKILEYLGMDFKEWRSLGLYSNGNRTFTDDLFSLLAVMNGDADFKEDLGTRIRSGNLIFDYKGVNITELKDEDFNKLKKCLKYGYNIEKIEWLVDYLNGKVSKPYKKKEEYKNITLERKIQEQSEIINSLKEELVKLKKKNVLLKKKTKNIRKQLKSLSKLLYL